MRGMHANGFKTLMYTFQSFNTCLSDASPQILKILLLTLYDYESVIIVDALTKISHSFSRAVTKLISGTYRFGGFPTREYVAY